MLGAVFGLRLCTTVEKPMPGRDEENKENGDDGQTKENSKRNPVSLIPKQSSHEDVKVRQKFWTYVATILALVSDILNIFITGFGPRSTSSSWHACIALQTRLRRTLLQSWNNRCEL